MRLQADQSSDNPKRFMPLVWSLCRNLFFWASVIATLYICHFMADLALK